jgi:hypothetical protein
VLRSRAGRRRRRGCGRWPPAWPRSCRTRAS